MSQEKTSLDCVNCPNPECRMIFPRNELVPGFGGVLLVIPEHQDPSTGAVCRCSFEKPIEMVNVSLPSSRKSRKRL
jgi:hypothetical protein